MAARKSADVKENAGSAENVDILEAGDGAESVQNPANDENAKDIGGVETDPMKRMVKIRLFKDNEKYKDDLFVSLNGMAYQIQRGIVVEVPEVVAEIIKRSEEADANTSMMIDSAKSEYKNVK